MKLPPICALFLNETSRPVTSEVARVTRLFPDHNREGLHYCSLEETPSEGKEVDDYQPRVMLKNIFAEGKLLQSDKIRMNVYFYNQHLYIEILLMDVLIVCLFVLCCFLNE